MSKVYEYFKQFEEEEEPVFAMCDEECEHTWEYQPTEDDVNIQGHQYCTKCGAVEHKEDDWLDEHDAMERYKDNL